MCCLSDINTCHRAPHRVFQLASEAQYRRCGLLESLYDRYRSGPRNFFRHYRHRKSSMELLLGPIRGLHQCYHGLPDCFSERLPAQPQLEELPQQRPWQRRPVLYSRKILEKDEPQSAKRRSWRYFDGYENDDRQDAARVRGRRWVRLIIYHNAKPSLEPKLRSTRTRCESNRRVISNDGRSRLANNRGQSESEKPSGTRMVLIPSKAISINSVEEALDLVSGK